VYIVAASSPREQKTVGSNPRLGLWSYDGISLKNALLTLPGHTKVRLYPSLVL
jgi:hypothetical protein